MTTVEFEVTGLATDQERSQILSAAGHAHRDRVDCFLCATAAATVQTGWACVSLKTDIGLDVVGLLPNTTTNGRRDQLPRRYRQCPVRSNRLIQPRPVAPRRHRHRSPVRRLTKIQQITYGVEAWPDAVGVFAVSK